MVAAITGKRVSVLKGAKRAFDGARRNHLANEKSQRKFFKCLKAGPDRSKQEEVRVGHYLGTLVDIGNTDRP
jgi:hypothetical protein